MKRRHTFTALLLLLTVLAISALTGCGSKAPTAQDAQNYAKAVLDLMCTGDYDHSIKLADVEEGKELEMRDQMIDDTIASLAGENGLSEEVQAEFKEVFVEAFSKCNYTVGSAAPDEQGEFDVSISIEPLKLFAGMEEKLDAQISSAFEDVDDASSLSTEEYNNRVFSLMAKLMKENLQTPSYDAPVEVVVHYGVLDEESKSYGISEEDGARLGQVLFSTSLD